MTLLTRTYRWARTALAFGAREICLTARHEDGFCLWPTAITNYSVAYGFPGLDVVRSFIASCIKYGLRPCLYAGPQLNGWLFHKLGLRGEEYVAAQLGQLKELLTRYTPDFGPNYVSRLWWDHYGSECGGLRACPKDAFPAAFPRFVKLVRSVSPGTAICPGPDCVGQESETGLGKYPTWYPCKPWTTPAGVSQCGGKQVSYSRPPQRRMGGFLPYETTASFGANHAVGGWFCKGSCDLGMDWKSPTTMWRMYMASVGIGWLSTLNAPAAATGLIPSALEQNMRSFGNALRSFLRPIALPGNGTAVAVDVRLACLPHANPLIIELGGGGEL